MSKKSDQQPAVGGAAPVPPHVQRSRLGGVWLALVLGAVVLVLLLVFILMNGQSVQLHLYGAHVTAPLGVALLLAAVLGILLVVIPGGGRILQLKRAARRLHRDRQVLTARLGDAQAPLAPEATPEERHPTSPPDTAAAAQGADVPRRHGADE